MMSFSFVNHIMADPDDALYEIRGVLDKLEESYPENWKPLLSSNRGYMGFKEKLTPYQSRMIFLNPLQT